MLTAINGLHHVTSMAKDASDNNRFFTNVLGLRRVKKTVNFDAPDVYHLYYGDEAGTPGTVMTYFPFPNIAAGQPGTGEVGTTLFSVPKGSLLYWEDRFEKVALRGVKRETIFGESRLHFSGPDGDMFALVETDGDARAPWTDNGIGEDHAIRGFHGAAIRVADDGAMAELLGFMNYEAVDKGESVRRFEVRGGGNGANFIELEKMPTIAPARLGSGSVHHIAFSVDNRQKQLEVRQSLVDTGYQVTPVIDRDYFWAIYFRTPGGILFEVATNEPGFDRDEDTAHLGEALKLPNQHEHLRAYLESHLQPIGN